MLAKFRSPTALSSPFDSTWISASISPSSSDDCGGLLPFSVAVAPAETELSPASKTRWPRMRALSKDAMRTASPWLPPAIGSNCRCPSRHRSRHGRGRRYRARVRQCSRGQARLDRFPSRAKTGPMPNWFPQLPRGSRKNSQKRNTRVRSRGAVRRWWLRNTLRFLGLLRISLTPAANSASATAIQG